jgi:hypothetical protein
VVECRLARRFRKYQSRRIGDGFCGFAGNIAWRGAKHPKMLRCYECGERLTLGMLLQYARPNVLPLSMELNGDESRYPVRDFSIERTKAGRIVSELLQLLNSWFLRLLLNLYVFLGDNGCDILKSLIFTKIH